MSETDFEDFWYSLNLRCNFSPCSLEKLVKARFAFCTSLVWMTTAQYIINLANFGTAKIKGNGFFLTIARNPKNSPFRWLATISLILCLKNFICHDTDSQICLSVCNQYDLKVFRNPYVPRYKRALLL